VINMSIYYLPYLLPNHVVKFYSSAIAKQQPKEERESTVWFSRGGEIPPKSSNGCGISTQFTYFPGF